MNIYLVFGIVILNSLKNQCDCGILISPKSIVLQGEKVNISCQFKRNINIMKDWDVFWNFNEVQIGENLKCFADFCEISRDLQTNRYDFIIKNATLKHKGTWSCNRNDEKSFISLNISVPWSLEAVQIPKLQFKNPESLNSNNYFETGEKRWPFNLLTNHSLNIVCESKCGLPGPESISVKYDNFTNTGELFGGTQKSENCSENKELKKMTHTITINCQKQKLTGLNGIHCESKGLHNNVISNKPVFILCPAFPIMDSLTLGEKVAIVVSVVLAIIDVVIIVFLLRKNCRELSKSKFAQFPEVML